MSENSIKLAFFFVFLVFSFTSAQNCTLGFQSYTSLVSCLTNIPFDEQVKISTIETLEAILPSYVFVDSVQNSADPVHIPISVNLQSGLAAISQSKYENDEQLQQAFASLFTELQDAHTRYTKPLSPYCFSSFVLPFKFYSRVQDNKQKIFILIQQDLVDQYNKFYPQFNTSINHFEVVSLESNDDPVAVLGNFANVSYHN